MITAGCDVGSLTAKAVIMNDGRVAGTGMIRAKTSPALSAQEVLKIALDSAGIALSDVSHTLATGYGKELITMADSMESEITCHARGAWWKVPTVRTVIDIGGQDAKAIKVNEKGEVVRYFYNDKCAAGTGRFLEAMAEALEIDLNDMGTVAATSTEPITISNQCVIFAETEVVSLVNSGKKVPDIARGLHQALASRVAALAKSIGVEKDVVMTGGVAKNSGVFDALAHALGVPIIHPGDSDPQLNGAIGAALIAADAVKARAA